MALLAATGGTAVPGSLGCTAEALAVRLRRDAGVSAEQATEEGGVLVTNGAPHLLHGAPGGLEQPARRRDAQLLQVAERRVARGGAEAPREVARAHPHARRQLLEAELLAEVLVDPVLRAGDVLILVAR